LQTDQQSIQQYLLRRSQLGDRRAQNEVFKLYVGAMYNVCRRMMGNDEDARDILQDSFVDAFTKLGGLRKLETFPAWLKRIVVNNCINALKKRKELLFEPGHAPNPAHDGDDAGEYHVQYEAGKIMKALAEISEGCRTVFTLYLFEGYDHKEISQILSISESASKAQYSKAKAKIRKLLAN